MSRSSEAMKIKLSEESVGCSLCFVYTSGVICEHVKGRSEAAKRRIGSSEGSAAEGVSSFFGCETYFGGGDSNQVGISQH